MQTRYSLVFLVLASCGGGAAQSTPPTPPATEPPAAEPVTEAPAPTDPAPAETPAAPPDPEQVKRDLLAAETAAFEAAKPVFEKHCGRCHSKASKKAKKKTLDHFDMTAYPFGGHHAAEVSSEIREVLGIGGGKATMPMDDPGAVTGDELALVTAWADAFDASHQGGAHEGHGDGKGHDHDGHKH